MKNRKQLIVVPPMSEAFLKLNEVLAQIADAEKIEITKIELGKDLNEMISAGQSLIIFSNAKNCALFLQENKSFIAKFNTKVILLIPKEIPGKTLTKFIKSGLTEAIFEGSPPKTLFHKVKMHLRSIKSGGSKSEEKDQVVSSMFNPNKISNAINDISSVKQKLSSQDELLKRNTLKEKTGAEDDKKSEARGKHDLSADEIGTNWNSKRKTNYKGSGIDNGAINFKNKRERDVYYPTTRKIDTSLKAISEYINKKNKLHDNTKNLPVRKMRNEVSLNLNGRGKERNELAEADYDLESNVVPEETVDYGLGNKFSKKESRINEDGEEDNLPDQADADDSIEERKNKKSKRLDDIELDLKTNSDQSATNSEAEAESTKSLDEDAGYRIEKKSRTLKRKNEIGDLADDDQNRQDDEDEIKKNKFAKRSIKETESEEEIEDDIYPFVVEELGNNPETKKYQDDEEVEGKSKKMKLPEESSAYSDKEKKSYKIVADDDDYSQREENEDGGDIYEKEKKEDIIIDMSGNSKKRKSHDDEEGTGDDGSSSLDLDEQESVEKSQSSKTNNEDGNDSDMSSNRTNQDNLEQDKNINNNSNRGKVNNLDASLKNDEAKKSAYSWDNLVDKNKSTSIDVRRNYQPQVDMDFSYLSKNVSEQTIDYRRIKKEFDKSTPFEELEVERHIPEVIVAPIPFPEEENPKKIIVQDNRGIIFSIKIIKLIYNKETVDDDYFKTISKELISQHNGYAVFYTYDLSSSKHLEIFNAFSSCDNTRIDNDLKESWDLIKEISSFNDYFTKTMPVWQCRDIQDKAKEGKFWEDIELPRWASSEMSDKKIELVFPYFDGVDLMGTAIVFFPRGVNAISEKSIVITMDTARTVFLNTVQRKSTSPSDRTQSKSILDKIKKVFSFVSRFFNKNKEENIKEESL